MRVPLRLNKGLGLMVLGFSVFRVCAHSYQPSLTRDRGGVRGRGCVDQASPQLVQAHRVESIGAVHVLEERSKILSEGQGAEEKMQVVLLPSLC